MTTVLMSEPGFPVQKMQELAPSVPGNEFLLQPVASSPGRLVLQSPTGSSVVEVTPLRAVIQTRYFGDFQAPEEHDKRSEYARRKISSFLDAWSQLDVNYSLCALSVVARWSLSDENSDEMRAAVERALPSLQPLIGGSFFDVTLRVSREFESSWFLNQYLQWYQDRSISFVAPIPLDMRIQEWQMPLSEQGLEFKFDFNNKRALYDQDLKWPATRILDTCTKGLAQVPAAFERVCDLLSTGVVNDNA